MSFRKKTAQIMHTLQTDYGDYNVISNKKTIQPENQPVKPCKHNCSGVEVKINSGSGGITNRKNTRQTLTLQTPIIIERKYHAKSLSSNKYIPQRKVNNLKKVQPFVPISIPTRDKQSNRLETNTTENTSRNKEIEIFIENDGQDKECLKKLFKKIHTLTDSLAQSQKQRVRLQLELDHVVKKLQECKTHQKTINKLEGDKYRLQMQNQILKKKVKDKEKSNPIETIKELVIQKPVEVKVEVPKYIPGPQRVVQRIVQVPKYVQIQKKIPEIIIKQIKIPQIIQKQVYVQRPVYKDPIIVDKPFYVQKPVYIDRPVQKKVEVQVEVPIQIEVPVYIDRPIVDDEWIRRFQDLEDELGTMMKENQILKSQNHNLRISMNKLQTNLDLISNHNRQKNRQIELLLNNRGDYLPLQAQFGKHRKNSALDRTNSTLSPRSHNHLRYL